MRDDASCILVNPFAINKIHARPWSKIPISLSVLAWNIQQKLHVIEQSTNLETTVTE